MTPKLKHEYFNDLQQRKGDLMFNSISVSQQAAGVSQTTGISVTGGNNKAASSSL